MMSQELRELIESKYPMHVIEGHFAMMSGRQAEDFVAWAIECVARYHGKDRAAQAIRVARFGHLA